MLYSTGGAIENLCRNILTGRSAAAAQASTRRTRIAIQISSQGLATRQVRDARRPAPGAEPGSTPGSMFIQPGLAGDVRAAFAKDVFPRPVLVKTLRSKHFCPGVFAVFFQLGGNL